MSLKAIIGILGLVIIAQATFESKSAHAETLRATATVERFYEGRNQALAWTGSANVVAYKKLIEALQLAKAHGLDPGHYHLAELRGGDPTSGDPALDRIATDAYLTLAAHLLSGRLDAVSIEPDWSAARRERDLAACLESSLGHGAIAASLEALAPAERPVERLLHAQQRRPPEPQPVPVQRQGRREY